MDKETEHQPAPRLGRPPKQASPVDHFHEIRSHIDELLKVSDQDRKNALGKIIVRLDRIEGK